MSATGIERPRKSETLARPRSESAAGDQSVAAVAVAAVVAAVAEVAAAAVAGY